MVQPQFVDSHVTVEELYESKRIEIWRHNNYINKEDDTKEHLGYFRYRDTTELFMIIKMLRMQYGA